MPNDVDFVSDGIGGLTCGALLLSAATLRPGGKRIVLYSIQTLMRRRHDWIRKDLSPLFDLMAHEKIDPIIAARCPLVEARRAHELLGTISVAGKIVFDARRLGDG